MERRAYSYQRKCDANVFAPTYYMDLMTLKSVESMKSLVTRS